MSLFSSFRRTRPIRLSPVLHPHWHPSRAAMSESLSSTSMSSMGMGTKTSIPIPIPVMQRVADVHKWRRKAFEEKKSVGYVATMGALHSGHLSLVKRSLDENDLTVVSIFVNPTQFAPHEDLASYPRTLPADLDLLASISGPRSTSLVFAPTASEMYPSLSLSLTDSNSDSGSGTDSDSDTDSGTGTYVDVGSLGSLMEGSSRPTFFRGVATIVTKLFNIIQPSHTYFGQKDIQQALLLRRLVSDLRFAYPTPETLHIVPTARDPTTGLALSSRNAYLTSTEKKYAPSLYAAMKEGESAWMEGKKKKDVIELMKQVLERETKKAKDDDDVDLRLDYVEMNDVQSFMVVGDWEDRETRRAKLKEVVIMSGALWVGRTRLIDNILLGDSQNIIR